MERHRQLPKERIPRQVAELRGITQDDGAVQVTRDTFTDELDGGGKVVVTTATFTCVTGRSRAPRSTSPVVATPRGRRQTGLRPIAELLADDADTN